MVMVGNLKEKVTKILTIIEQIDNDNVSQIEKDILLQETRELYSEILLIGTDVCQNENKVESQNEEQSVSEIRENPETNVIPEPVVETVIAAAFDDKEFDYSDLLGLGTKKSSVFDDEQKKEDEKTEQIQEVFEDKLKEETENIFTEETINPVAEAIVENFDDEIPTEEKIEEIEITTDEISESEQIVENIVDENLETEEIAENVPEEIPTVEEPIEEVVESESVANETANNSTENSEPVRLTLGEQLGQSRQSSLNDMFANNKPADLSSRFGLKPVTDIKSAIGLGERYRFTRQLFSGSGNVFDETISHLNSLSSYDEAVAYVSSKFDWDMNSEVVSDFMNIVVRRYL